MAAVGRADETQIVNDNIYDNNAKEIDPAMVRAVLISLIESNFNLVDDLLKDLNYDTGVTLESYVARALVGSTGYFDVGGGTTGSISGSTGIVSSASKVNTSSSDSIVTVNFSQDISDRYLTIALITNNTAENEENDICYPVYRRVNSTQIRVGLREVTGVFQSIRMEILAFKAD